MQFEPLLQKLIVTNRLNIDLERGHVFSSKSNTPQKPLGALTKKGYLRICLHIDGRPAHAFVHRIVWATAHGPLKDGMQIDHVNGIKTDNRLKNLQAVDGTENMRRAARNGLTNGGWRSAPRDQKTGQFLGKKAGRLVDGKEWSQRAERMKEYDK